MKIAGLSLIFFSAVASFAIAPQAQNSAMENQRRQREMEEVSRRNQQIGFSRLQAMRERMYRGKTVPRSVFQDVSDLYREATKKELERLKPADEDLISHASFLKQKNTGIVRLVEEAGCGDTTRILSAASPCVQYSMPGNGSSFSFRENSYRIDRLSDLTFGGGNFSTAGILRHSILTGIGDVPLELVNLDTKGLKHLNEFQPSESFANALEVGIELQNPVEIDGFYYAQGVRAFEPMTYVLRSVAYRGNNYRSVGGFVYDELDFDKRLDLTVAFRIIRRHDDGSVTLLWKEIARRTAPVLKVKKGEPTRIDRSKYAAKER